MKPFLDVKSIIRPASHAKQPKIIYPTDNIRNNLLIPREHTFHAHLSSINQSTLNSPSLISHTPQLVSAAAPKTEINQTRPLPKFSSPSASLTCAQNQRDLTYKSRPAFPLNPRTCALIFCCGVTLLVLIKVRVAPV